MSSDDFSVDNYSLSEITNNITNIYNNFSFDNINSFSNDDVNTIVSILNAPTDEIQNSIAQKSGILNKSFINSLVNNVNTYYNASGEINNQFINLNLNFNTSFNQYQYNSFIKFLTKYIKLK